MTPKCCGVESSWIENVPGRGYNFCSECRKEVAPMTETDMIANLFEEMNPELFNMQASYFPQPQVDDAIQDLLITIDSFNGIANDISDLDF